MNEKKQFPNTSAFEVTTEVDENGNELRGKRLNNRLVVRFDNAFMIYEYEQRKDGTSYVVETDAYTTSERVALGIVRLLDAVLGDFPLRNVQQIGSCPVNAPTQYHDEISDIRWFQHRLDHFQRFTGVSSLFEKDGTLKLTGAWHTDARYNGHSIQRWLTKTGLKGNVCPACFTNNGASYLEPGTQKQCTECGAVYNHRNTIIKAGEHNPADVRLLVALDDFVKLLTDGKERPWSNNLETVLNRFVSRCALIPDEYSDKSIAKVAEAISEQLRLHISRTSKEANRLTRNKPLYRVLENMHDDMVRHIAAHSRLFEAIQQAIWQHWTMEAEYIEGTYIGSAVINYVKLRLMPLEESKGHSFSENDTTPATHVVLLNDGTQTGASVVHNIALSQLHLYTSMYAQAFNEYAKANPGATFVDATNNLLSIDQLERTVYDDGGRVDEVNLLRLELKTGDVITFDIARKQDHIVNIAEALYSAINAGSAKKTGEMLERLGAAVSDDDRILTGRQATVIMQARDYWLANKDKLMSYVKVIKSEFEPHKRSMKFKVGTLAVTLDIVASARARRERLYGPDLFEIDVQIHEQIHGGIAFHRSDGYQSITDARMAALQWVRTVARDMLLTFSTKKERVRECYKKFLACENHMQVSDVPVTLPLPVAEIMVTDGGGQARWKSTFVSLDEALDTIEDQRRLQQKREPKAQAQRHSSKLAYTWNKVMTITADDDELRYMVRKTSVPRQGLADDSYDGYIIMIKDDLLQSVEIIDVGDDANEELARRYAETLDLVRDVYTDKQIAAVDHRDSLTDINTEYQLAWSISISEDETPTHHHILAYVKAGGAM